MTPQKISEYALAALKASRRDASWLADQMLDAAKTTVFDHQAHRAAMDLVAKFVSVRDALAERIEILEIITSLDPEICGNVVRAEHLFRRVDAALAAEQKHDDGGPDARVH